MLFVTESDNGQIGIDMVRTLTSVGLSIGSVNSVVSGSLGSSDTKYLILGNVI